MKHFKESKDKVGHYSQLGGIELSTLASGNAAGTKVAWINTGTGLQFQVILDRGMDIGRAFFNQYALSWISHNGPVHPSGNADEAANWLKYFSSGLVTTCGIDHIGPPEDTNGNALGLHGRYSNLKAELVSIKQPSLIDEDYTYALSGRIIYSKVFGPHYEILRTIKGKLGEPFFYIEDNITNLGNEKAPFMQLYHMNFGYPLLDDQTLIYWEGSTIEKHSQLFGIRDNHIQNVGPTVEHNGNREGVIFIDPKTGSKESSCGIVNPKLNFGLKVIFNTDQLPYLTLWQHLGVREYVSALEPCTNHPIGQSRARAEDELKYILPGESLNHQMKLEIIQEKEEIDVLIKKIQQSEK